MMKRFYVMLTLAVLAASACEPTTRPAELDDSYAPVSIQSKVDAVQPSTGLVLWSDNARERNAAYGKSISLEYAYCLPCKVVTGKENGEIRYDWSSFESWLRDVASRKHQAVVRFRYEYPGERSVDGNPGTTAVPAYIKALEDYNETFYENEDGPTWYSDWTNKELQWFTKQFYADFNATRPTRASPSSRLASATGANIISTARPSGRG